MLYRLLLGESQEKSIVFSCVTFNHSSSFCDEQLLETVYQPTNILVQYNTYKLLFSTAEAYYNMNQDRDRTGRLEAHGMLQLQTVLQHRPLRV